VIKERSKRRAKERKTELESKRKGKLEREIVKLGLYEKGRREVRGITGVACRSPVSSTLAC